MFTKKNNIPTLRTSVLNLSLILLLIDNRFCISLRGSSRARAAELLKKKPIAKPNPNCELMSRKRNREESEKKVGAVLNPDEPPEVSEPLIQGAKNRETNDFGDETSNEAKRPRLIRSFTGELIDEAKMAQLKKVKRYSSPGRNSSPLVHL